MQNAEKFNEYKRRLEEEKQKLLADFNRENKPADFGNDVDGFDEETDEAEERSNRLGVSDAYRTRINEIDAALNRIEKGEYGICTQCGGTIETEVLNTAPESQLCETCKKQ